MVNTAFKKFTGSLGTIFAIRDDGHCCFVTKAGDITKYMPDKRGRSIAVKVLSESHLWKFLNKSTNPKAPALKRWIANEIIPVLRGDNYA